MLTQRQVAEKIWNTGKGYGHIFNDISKEECIEKIEKHIKNYSIQYYGETEISLQEKLTESKEITELLKKKIEELERKLNFTYCAYCGKEFPIGEQGLKDIGEHIHSCEKHPIADYQKRISILEQAVREAKETIATILPDYKTSIGYDQDGKDLYRTLAKLEKVLK